MTPTIPVPYPAQDGILNRIGYGPYAGDQSAIYSRLAAEYQFIDEHFHGAAINGTHASAVTNGTSAARTFTAGNGYLLLVTGTSDDGYAGSPYSLSFNGDRGILLDFYLKTPAAVTTLKFEAGLTDALSGDVGAVNVKATPTANATDFAVMVFDTDDDVNLACVSAKAGTVVATQDITHGAIAAATMYHGAIRVSGDNVEFWWGIAGQAFKRVASHVNNAGIEGGSALTPWFFAQARAGSASRSVELHSFRIGQPRY